MNILLADDEQSALNILSRAVKEAQPDAHIRSFTQKDALLEVIQSKTFLPDVAFLDIEMPGINGLELARRLKLLCPQINIVFVTGYSQYALDAYALRPSGYLTKPVTRGDVEVELQNLRNPVLQTSDKRVRVQCFGNFEIFVDGLPLHFMRSQTKELLALLVDRNGAALNTEQICAVLWEDDPDIDAQKNRLRHLVSDLTNTLREADAEDIFLKRRNSFAVVRDSFDCDYYDFRRGLPSGVNAYSGEYMSQYSWSEMTLGGLE